VHPKAPNLKYQESRGDVDSGFCAMSVEFARILIMIGKLGSGGNQNHVEQHHFPSII
jgi:hypothetical protein